MLRCLVKCLGRLRISSQNSVITMDSVMAYDTLNIWFGDYLYCNAISDIFSYEPDSNPLRGRLYCSDLTAPLPEWSGAEWGVFLDIQAIVIDVLCPLLCTRYTKWAGRPPKDNEAKSNMKHPSDMPTQRFELRWWRSVIQRITI